MTEFAASAAAATASDSADFASTRVASAAAAAAAAFTAPAPPVATAVDMALLKRAYGLMHTAAEMAALYEEEKAVAARYVHAAARGHEAVQLAAAFLLTETDPGVVFTPEDLSSDQLLMAQTAEKFMDI